jgi:hypothetical protein
MDILSSLAVVTLAALIHASFQLSVSMLTLLSGQTTGSGRTGTLRLTSSFVAGSGFITLLLVSFLAFIITRFVGPTVPTGFWMVACALALVIGIAVWTVYYRRKKGTSLWVPRSIASFISKRMKATDSGVEAFSLGIMGVIGELIFLSAPLLMSALVLVQVPAVWQLVGVLLYAVVSLLTLGSVWVLIGGGHKISEIQKWRESNKHFLQFFAGGGLVILGAFVYVFVVLGNNGSNF